jgi:hypothetical protein
MYIKVLPGDCPIECLKKGSRVHFGLLVFESAGKAEAGGAGEDGEPGGEQCCKGTEEGGGIVHEAMCAKGDKELEVKKY